MLQAFATGLGMGISFAVVRWAIDELRDWLALRSEERESDERVRRVNERIAATADHAVRDALRRAREASTTADPPDRL